MARSSRPVLSRPSANLRERLGRWRRPKTTDGAAFTQAEELDGLKSAGDRLRQAREAQGLNLRQLALATRISSPVIEALERGWRDRLPAATYLRTMLPLLEDQLGLPAGSLDGALPSSEAQPADRSRRLVLRFTPGSIDVFTTWQGTWLYAGLCLALLYGVNLQQQQLASAGLLALWDRDILQFFLTGLVLFGLGLLGEYIGRIYQQVRSRPRFLIQAILEKPDTTSARLDP